MSALFRWPCSISIHLSPRSVTAGARPFSLAIRHLYSFVSQVCHWWCPPFSAGHAAFLFICLRLSLLVSALFRWARNRSVTAAVRWPCNVALLFVCLPGLVSALFCWPCSISIHLPPRSVIGDARPFLLAMQHFYAFASQVCHCWCLPLSAGDATFLLICLPGLSLLVSAFFRWPCSISIHLSPRPVTGGVHPFLLAM